MKKKFTYIFAGLAVVLGMSACVKDLDVTPIDPNLVLLDDPSFLFNKCYANLALAGNGGSGIVLVRMRTGGNGVLVLVR